MEGVEHGIDTRKNRIGLLLRYKNNAPYEIKEVRNEVEERVLVPSP